jgi:hypothetical protein
MKTLFGGFIAVVLLVLYVWLSWYGGSVIRCATTNGCTTLAVADFTDNMSAALSVISGLVSALVIAELSITQAGQAPVGRILDANASGLATGTLKLVVGIYLLVWIAVGLFAFQISLRFPKTLPPITDLGQAWFGLAVAAAYAYLGIRPNGPGNPPTP